MVLFLHYPDFTGVASASYRVVFRNGEWREGRLDAKGRAELHNVPSESAHVYYGETVVTRAPEAPPSLQPTDAQIRDELRDLGYEAGSAQDIDNVLAHLTERAHD